MSPYTPAFFVGAALGVPASLLAAFLYDKIKTTINMKRNKFNIAGTWGEYVPDSKGRQYSLGRIFYDRRRKLWAFDGTNFQNNGRPYCHWRTVTSFLDLENRQFFYTFDARVEGELGAVYYGFGVVHLTPDNDGVLVPINGHYVSASVDGKGMSHSMVLGAQLPYSRRVAGNDAIQFIRQNTPKLLRYTKKKA